MPFNYNKKVLEYFLKPKNVGKITRADGVGQVKSPVCGDVMTLYIKVKNNRIKDIKFHTFGCAAAIASSSILTEIVKGKTLKEAKKITKDKIIKALGGLPRAKIHCSVLADKALHQAIHNYEVKLKNKLKGGKIKNEA